jgi:hypothetical protein
VAILVALVLFRRNYGVELITFKGFGIWPGVPTGLPDLINPFSLTDPGVIYDAAVGGLRGNWLPVLACVCTRFTNTTPGIVIHGITKGIAIPSLIAGVLGLTE